MTPQFRQIFPQASSRPVIAVIHLLPLPGAPRYDGNLDAVYDRALREAKIFVDAGVDSIIIENFGDIPFYTDRVPHETVAAMAAVSREVKNVLQGQSLGINVLRNDASAAVAIAAAVGAEYIRVNIHMGAAVTDQGIIQTRAWETLRLISNLRAKISVFADVAVKHAVPLAGMAIEQEARDLAERGMVEGLIVSGSGTGHPTDEKDLIKVRQNSHLPILIGSGVTHENVESYFPLADAFIVGSCFKEGGLAQNGVDAKRVNDFMEIIRKRSK
ncbi:MAG: BtpA/SgcQ family protein [Bacteroidia bacterium]|nr:BtpA/SgcQ family protein [Bacteroidia bacterium]